MTPDRFRRALWQTYGDQEPKTFTPNRILTNLDQSHRVEDFSIRNGFAGNREVLRKKFFSGKGVNEEVLEKFVSSLDRFIGEHGEQSTIFIEESDIRKGGSINFKKVEKRMREI